MGRSAGGKTVCSSRYGRCDPDCRTGRQCADSSAWAAFFATIGRKRGISESVRHDTKNKNVFYAFDPVSNTGVELGYSIFEKLPDDYLTNIFTLGGWETESPQIVDNLEKYDCRSLLTGLYTSDQAVLISDTMLEHIMLHLQDIY